MKFSENWLRQLVEIPVDRATLARDLTMIGHEAEELVPLGEGLNGVVVAEIVAAGKHPDADRLQVCTVDAGQGQPLQIVCGAPNARVGLKAPLAMVGAKLPGGIAIKQAELRGVASSGMLCSARELGVDTEASGLMELPADAPAGMPLADYLGLPDASIELGLTPNRPDCLGLVGLAHDVAALYDASVNEPSDEPVKAAINRQYDVRLEAGSDCPRFLARVIEGIDAGAKSPSWLAERLRRSGIRPISAVVDVTQYVMLELGQPMHAYDLDRLHGPISVRRARSEEPVKLLDGNQIMADPECLLIADEKDALGLAGIMGGFDSRVTETTRNVLLEAAHFDPVVIMGRARRFGLHTDASHRFERGVDPELPRRAIERATTLLLTIAGGKPGPVTEAVLSESLPQRKAVTLRRERLARVLGMRIDDAEVERILRKLDMRVEGTAEGWRVTPPSRRFDIEIEEDLIEEIVRIYGYQKVPVRPPGGELRLALPAEARTPLGRLRNHLASRGFREAICYSFVSRDLLARWSMGADAVALANPLSADLAVMRTSLLPGLCDALKRNVNRQQDRVRLSEIGMVFSRVDGELRQVNRIAAVACGRALPESWNSDKRVVDFYDLKADVESLLALAGQGRHIEFVRTDEPWLHPGRSARVCIDGQAVGVVAGLNPRLLKALDIGVDVQVFELDLHSVASGQIPCARELSRFPSLRRDIAIVVPEATQYAHIAVTLHAALGKSLSELVVFDQYSGPNLGSDVKSLAIGLILQDDSRTLTDKEADRYVAQALTALELKCHARLRG